MFSFKHLSILSLLTFFLFNFTFSASSAQSNKIPEKPEKVQFEGRVLNDRTGKAVSNAEVHIVDEEIKVNTGKNGRFTFEKLSEGTHRLKIEKEGFRKWMRTIQVKEGLRVVISIKPDYAK